MTLSRLGPFQQRVLEAFFERAPEGFYLTGGAALGGFHLGHRTTEDLDLFTPTDELDEGVAALQEVARSLGATLEGLRTSPYQRRFLLRREHEGVVVDLVYEPVPQGVAAKPKVGAIRVDPASEILANKLGALLQRAELRDLVDVRALEQAGHRVERALPLAMRKDAGLTAAQLAWVLSQVEIGDEASLPGGVPASELREYLEDLRSRLLRLALPE